MIGLLGRLLSGNGGMLSEPQITLVAQMGCDGLCVGSPGGPYQWRCSLAARVP